MTTWNKEILLVLTSNKETWKDIIAHEPKDKAWGEYLFDDYSLDEVFSFTLWTKKYVYFSDYNGKYQYVNFVKRDPDVFV